MEVTISGITVECARGDIASQPDVEAVVSSGDGELVPAGREEGAPEPGLPGEAEPGAPLDPGEAVLADTAGFPNRLVIRCRGPVYGRDEPADELLAECYRTALELAEQEGAESVAMPAISTGAFGYPLGAAAEVAVQAVLDRLGELESIRRVRFVLEDPDAFETFSRMLAEETEEPG